MKATIIAAVALLASPAFANNYDKCMQYQREDTITGVLAPCMANSDASDAMLKFCNAWAEATANSERNVESSSAYCHKYAKP